MWNNNQNQLLVAILDQLVPANVDKGVPGAGALGMAGFIGTATDYASDPVGAVTRILEAVAGEAEDFAAMQDAAKVAVLKEVEAVHPGDFATLVRLTYLGYYSRADIRPLFGVGAHPVHPKGYDVSLEDAALMDDLTAPVRARGQFFRDP